MTEVWYRNPHNYIRELVECRGKTVAWDRGMLVKRKLDPYKHAELYFGHAGITDWRLLLVGEAGTAELRPGRNVNNPVAVYPTWTGGESLEILEEMMASPIGEDEESCDDMVIPVDQRPVRGQEHRVIVTELPSQVTGPGRALMRKLVELQEDYPECILHLHGLYSWRVNFGMGFASADVDPRSNAGKGKVTLPSGKEMIAEKTIGCPQWVTLLGMNVVDLKEPRVRCMYNIKSAAWAAENFEKEFKFKSRGSGTADITTKKPAPVLTSNTFSRPVVPQPGDKFQCDTCSLQDQCKYYRQGAVCTLPGAETNRLAQTFKTRDSGKIIDALGDMLALQTERMQRGMEEEELYGELDPEVTKMMKNIFDQGTKLAKLRDPSLNGGAKVQVNVGGNVGAIQASSPNQVMAAIVANLESQGIRREDITPLMIENVLSQMTGNDEPKQITGQVIGNE